MPEIGPKWKVQRTEIKWKQVMFVGISSMISAVIISMLTAMAGCVVMRIKSEEDFLNWLSIAVLSSLFLSMFLGGVWITRKIESRFVLHGTLIGIVAGILFLAFYAFLLWQRLSTGHVNAIIPSLYLPISMVVLQVIVGMLGGYIGGKFRK